VREREVLQEAGPEGAPLEDLVEVLLGEEALEEALAEGLSEGLEAAQDLEGLPEVGLVEAQLEDLEEALRLSTQGKTPGVQVEVQLEEVRVEGLWEVREL